MSIGTVMAAYWSSGSDRAFHSAADSVAMMTDATSRLVMETIGQHVEYEECRAKADDGRYQPSDTALVEDSFSHSPYVILELTDG